MKYAAALLLAVVSGGLLLVNANRTKIENLPVTDSPSEAITDNRPPNVVRQPVLVELFTSEGCSSCPAADKTLTFLAQEQPFSGAEIIALSQHVDYWNRLGWTDPFSSAQFSQRQGEYSNFFGQNGNVYTPQMVVDGTSEFVGSNVREAQKAITEAARINKATIELTARKEKDAVAFDIKIADLPQKFESAIVLLAIAEDNLTSNVARGENGGQKLAHVAVARSLSNVGIVKAGDKSYSVAPIIKLQKSWKSDNLSAVVFVQDLKTRQIYAIAKTSLKSIGKL